MIGEKKYFDYSPYLKRNYRILYQGTNKPFTGNLSESVSDLKKRVKMKKASMIIIDGSIGEGKTTLAEHVANEYQGFPIDYKKQYAMGGEQFQEKLQICIDSGLDVLIYDEAGDFNKRSALTKFNAEINRIFETYRTYGILIIMALPSMDSLDNNLFEKGIPRLLLHCYNRNNNYGRYSAYSLYRMYYLRDNFKGSVVKPHAYKKTKPNYYGTFLNLPNERSLALEKISTDGKREILSLTILKNKGLLNYHEISRAVGRSLRWVKEKINEIDVQPEQVYKRAKYFDKSVLPQLLELK